MNWFWVTYRSNTLQYKLVSVEIFAGVSALELLDLSYNNLRTVDINILTALPKLSELYLYGNRLQCDCQLQEVWRWCEFRNKRKSYVLFGAECGTKREVSHLHSCVKH